MTYASKKRGGGAIDFWWGGNKNLVGEFFQVGGWSKFLAGGGGIPTFPPVGRTNRKGGLRIWNFQRY